MPLITWADSLSVGHAALDEDHRRLVALVNDFFESWAADTDRSRAAALLNELIVYTDTHFLREERILEERDYPRLANQRLAHQELRAEVHLIRQKIGENDPTLSSKAIGRVLESWLIDHIIAEDKLYRVLFT